MVHRHVLEHGVEHERIPRYPLPWFGDEFSETELVLRICSGRVFNTLEGH